LKNLHKLLEKVDNSGWFTSFGPMHKELSAVKITYRRACKADTLVATHFCGSPCDVSAVDKLREQKYLSTARYSCILQTAIYIVSKQFSFTIIFYYTNLKSIKFVLY
jgi:hypothetical protein